MPSSSSSQKIAGVRGAQLTDVFHFGAKIMGCNFLAQRPGLVEAAAWQNQLILRPKVWPIGVPNVFSIPQHFGQQLQAF